jgi:hypothetical protein
MAARFSNEHDWFTVTAAMAVWAAHFMLLWTASVVFPSQAAGRWIALALTLLAGAALAWLWLRASRPPLRSAAGLGLAIAAAGVAFDFAPAVLA